MTGPGTRHRALTLAFCAILVGACEGTPAVTYTSPAPGTSAKSWNFDGDAPGSPPSGSEVFTGTWVVRAEVDAPSKPNALCQTGNAEFPAMALGREVYADVSVTMRFKPISGQVDQTGGVIARVQDKDNYYILRAKRARVECESLQVRGCPADRN